MSENRIGKQLALQAFNWKMIIIVFLISVGFALYFMKGFHSWPALAVGVIWSAVIWYTQWFGNGYIVYKLDEKISWIEEPLKRFLLGLFFLVIYSFLAILVVNFLFQLMLGQLPKDPLNWIISNGLTAVTIAFTISFILTAIGFFHSWRKSSLEAEQFKAEMMLYKYESLRSQINPHFLFNSLNVLSSLVYDDQKLAVRFIHQLSEVYRYVLDSKDKEVVNLQEEMEFMNSYLFLLKIRFEENLELSVDLKGDPNMMVVPMAFQMLLENAVKHNEVSSAKPLGVKLYREGDYAVVENSLQRKSIGETSNKIGLQNIRSRYSILTDRPVEVYEDQDLFRVKIPLLKVEN